MVTHEYTTLTTPNLLTPDQLDEHAADGWRLVALTPFGEMLHYVFEREVEDEPPIIRTILIAMVTTILLSAIIHYITH